MDFITVKMSGGVTPGGIDKRKVSLVHNGKEIKSSIKEITLRYAKEELITAEIVLLAEAEVECQALLSSVRLEKRSWWRRFIEKVR